MKSKILFLDIETSPNLSYIWGHYEQNALEVEEPWFLMSYSAKWLGGKQETKCLMDYDGYENALTDDVDLVNDIWQLLNEADIVIAHNGDKFDIKKLNTRFIFNGLTPPEPYRTIDTLKIAKRHFAFNSNRLDDLGEFLGLGRKIETHKKLWFDCMIGDRKAWEKMKKYNAQDVKLLEKVYFEFLPWISNHPNLGMYSDELVCPKCGSDDIQFRGYSMNQTTKYRRFMCNSCGGWGRTTHNERTEKPLINGN